MKRELESNLKIVKTIECSCGYIATFESYIFICPDCGRSHRFHTSTLTIKAKDFATELTSHNVIDKNLLGENQIATEHVENNQAVRHMLIERGVKPETLPPAADIKKVQRKVESDKKKLLKNVKKGAL